MSAPVPAPAPDQIGLVDASGRPFTLAELRGRFIWLYLGYASCPDACPRTLDAMVAAYNALPDKTQVVPVFVSVDPMRDTPERLKAYTGFFHSELFGASGPHFAIDALVRALGTRYEIPPGATPEQHYVVGHPDEVFILDSKSRYVGRLNARQDIFTALPRDLKQRLQAPQAPAPLPPVPPPGTADAWCADPHVSPTGSNALHADPRMGRAATLGSGTSVLPATTPMRMWAWNAGEWLWMAHLNAVLGINEQNGPRGSRSHVAENWQMFMGTRYLGDGLLDLRMMTSLEPLTLPPGGTHQMLQAGETYQNKPLIDRQHPHDLLGELSARYTWNPFPSMSLFAYGGIAGEPALGPAAFMHRPSAADNHWAPLAHHNQDATHVSYGVLTSGLRLGAIQFEGSVFNGREPNENRFDIDWGPLDSWATRLSFFPGRNWVGQISYGHLRSPSPEHPGDEGRTTASVSHVSNTALGRWSNTFIFGQSALFEQPLAEPELLLTHTLETQLDWDGRNHLYGRFESLDRSGLPPRAPGSHASDRISALTLGFARDLGQVERWALALGGDVTTYGLSDITRRAYGENPFAARLYLRLRPPTMVHDHDRNPAADGEQVADRFPPQP